MKNALPGMRKGEADERGSHGGGAVGRGWRSWGQRWSAGLGVKRRMCGLDPRFLYCVLRFHFFFSFFFFNSWFCWLFSVNNAPVLCSQTHKFLFWVTFSLKMGPTVLFTHLKIILLQCFQFSVFNFSKISFIQTDLKCEKEMWLRLEGGKCEANKFRFNPRVTFLCALHSGQPVRPKKKVSFCGFLGKKTGVGLLVAKQSGSVFGIFKRWEINDTVMSEEIWVMSDKLTITHQPNKALDSQIYYIPRNLDAI